VLPPDANAEQVFVTDGAQWIHHWLQASYPHATLLLDFYHVDTVGEFIFRPLPAELIARRRPDGSGLTAPRLTS
jgi:hypothetical protein